MRAFPVACRELAMYYKALQELLYVFERKT